jgi:tRNA U38,U39,U40 pseudouridine synthase TruA
LPVADVATILQAAKRTERIRTAPARGLFLHRVDYPPLPDTAAALPHSSATG